MKIQLIHGHFNSNDAMDIITQMIHVKIRFHENKIQDSSTEEDIKMRESRIRQLQKELFEARKVIEKNKGQINLEGEIQL
jgi:predicted RNase H-like nuclease (RuvC/YqgF family)